MKKYNQELSEEDVLKLFEKQRVITIFDICITYKCSVYRAKMVLSGMELKNTSYGYKQKETDGRK